MKGNGHVFEKCSRCFIQVFLLLCAKTDRKLADVFPEFLIQRRVDLIWWFITYLHLAICHVKITSWYIDFNGSATYLDSSKTQMRYAYSSESGLNLVKTKKMWDINFYNYSDREKFIKGTAFNKDNWQGRTQILNISHFVTEKHTDLFEICRGASVNRSLLIQPCLSRKPQKRSVTWDFKCLLLFIVINRSGAREKSAW